MNKKPDLEKIAKKLDFTLDELEMLVSLFLESGFEDIKSMKKAFYDGDFNKITKLAHGLKGASANLYLEDINILTKEIETNAKEVLDFEYEKKIDQLEELLHKLK